MHGQFSVNIRLSSSISSESRPSRADQSLDLAHGMQHRRVVAAAEAPADLRQRARRQRFGEEHGDLARAHHIRRPPGGEDVGLADVVMAGDELLDVLDLDPFRLARAHQILDRGVPPLRDDSGARFSEACATSRLTAPSRSRPFV